MNDPAPEHPADVTRILRDWHQGDGAALEQLMPLVVDELRRIARGYFVKERMDHTLQPTALVNEVFLRLLDVGKIEWQDRRHFLAIAARLMRRVLVDHARNRLAAKRGGDVVKASLDLDRILPEGQDLDLVSLDDALRDMAKINPEASAVVEMRFFAGLTRDEIADVLGISTSTVKRKWTTAKFWLYRHLNERGSTVSLDL